MRKKLALFLLLFPFPFPKSSKEPSQAYGAAFTYCPLWSSSFSKEHESGKPSLNGRESPIEPSDACHKFRKSILCLLTTPSKKTVDRLAYIQTDITTSEYIFRLPLRAESQREDQQFILVAKPSTRTRSKFKIYLKGHEKQAIAELTEDPASMGDYVLTSFLPTLTPGEEPSLEGGSAEDIARLHTVRFLSKGRMLVGRFFKGETSSERSSISSLGGLFSGPNEFQEQATGDEGHFVMVDTKTKRQLLTFHPENSPLSFRMDFSGLLSPLHALSVFIAATALE